VLSFLAFLFLPFFSCLSFLAFVAADRQVGAVLCFSRRHSERSEAQQGISLPFSAYVCTNDVLPERSLVTSHEPLVTLPGRWTPATACGTLLNMGNRDRRGREKKKPKKQAPKIIQAPPRRETHQVTTPPATPRIPENQ
jgi:hypothetical protein